MSRSRKKPFGSICCVSRRAMKDWRTQNNRTMRRNEDDLPDGNHYKRINDVWNSPSDGKCRYDDPKSTRK